MTHEFINSPSRNATETHNLACKFPDVAALWSNRNPVSPQDVAPSANKRAWWVCEKGHEFDANVNKVTRGRGCPYCSGKRVLPGFNDLASVYPHIAKDLDDAKNGGITGENVAAKSSQRLWFKCDKGHRAHSIVKKRVTSNGCPQCKERVKRNALSVDHPDLVQYWDAEKNGDLTAGDVTSGSKKKVWWLCDYGHSFSTSVIERVRAGVKMCPVCNRKKVVAGVNDLATMLPDLAQEWDEKKNTMSPHEVAPRSMKSAHWICDKGHQWEELINRRSLGEKCPYCSRKRVLAGFNDLATTHPDLAAQWDNENNGDLRPHDVTSGSNTVVHWVCEKGHKYSLPVKSRTGSRRTGCSYCTGRKVLAGFNDIATTHPDLVEKYWDFDMNTTRPQEVTHGMTQKVWWKCDEGHTCEIAICSKTRRHSLCPKCSCSSGERELADTIIDLAGSDAVRTSVRDVISPYELDIYIPEKNIAIEYNGVYWHSEARREDKNYHYKKWKMCKDNGVQLITVWEDEWRDKREIVTSMLAHKLGVSQDKKVYARTTAVQRLESSVARQFLDTYHIQGHSSGGVYFGLYSSDNTLVAVSAWRRSKGMLYLDRYATACVVVGGMGKLLAQGVQFAREHECTHIVTFADHCVSDGGLYEILGFTADKEVTPDYKYLVDGCRKHKFNYRIKKFRNDPELIYREGLTELELAELNGMDRIWDCGKTRYIMGIEA